MLTYMTVLIQHHLRRFSADERGAVATEYAFLITFIAIVAAAGMLLLGNGLNNFFSNIATSLNNAGSSIPSVT
ncbi:MAG TPA: Flp family type IVb pilin [Woeseiaceae bacterium]|jgi:Flp pilus assembly pilin Flp|nr:Flp family type IVb pilin [Woeseiaceae bacterium]